MMRLLLLFSFAALLLLAENNDLNNRKTSLFVMVSAWQPLAPVRRRLKRRQSSTKTTTTERTTSSDTPSSSWRSNNRQMLPNAPKLEGLHYSRWIGIMRAFQEDAATAMRVYADYCREHNLPGVKLDGGIVVGKFDFIVDPQVVEWVLTDKAQPSSPQFKEGIFYKSALDRRGVGLLTGRGSLLTDGPDHTRKRRLILPSMNNRGNLQKFLQIMKDVSLEYADEQLLLSNNTASATITTTTSSGSAVNVGELMSAIAMKIVGLALFSQDVVNSDIYKEISVCLEHVVYVTRHPFALPLWVPTRRNRRFRRSLRCLDDLVYSFIESGQEDRAKKRNGEARGDEKNLLNMLLAARYESSEEGMPPDDPKLTDQELRDEIMTLFLAGHETTAITLCWTLWYLSDPRHVHWQATIAKEYERIHQSSGTGYTPAIVEDPKALEVTRAVLCEALRLRTPSYAVDREVQQSIDIPVSSTTDLHSNKVTSGTIHWKKKDILLISPMAMHLNPDVFENPDDFDPTRFLGFIEKGKAGNDLWEGPFDRSVYLPFGAGRKRCIGYKFAQWELLVILGTLLSRCEVTRPAGVTDVAWEAGVTLRPDRDLELIFAPRKRTTA